MRFGSFQVVSILTTTGYATADYEQWPALSQLILLGCMFLGASAGSTGGGVKCLRVIICLKYCYRELFSLIHPRAVTHIKIAGKPVSDDLIRSVMGFLALYFGLFALSSVILAGLGVDFVTAFTATASGHREYRAGVRHGGTVGKFCHDSRHGKMAAQLLHAFGTAGNLHCDHSFCAGILAAIGHFRDPAVSDPFAESIHLKTWICDRGQFGRRSPFQQNMPRDRLGERLKGCPFMGNLGRIYSGENNI